MTDEATISTRILTRVLLALIALWSFVAGVTLVAYAGSAGGVLGGGLSDHAAQRLAGAHMLVLVPLYLLIAWRIDRYAGLLWVPFLAQAAVVLSIGYSIIANDSEPEDGALALVVSAIFAVLFAFVWISEQRTVAQQAIDEEESATTGPSELVQK
jgi:hypothetical protein